MTYTIEYRRTGHGTHKHFAGMPDSWYWYSPIQDVKTSVVTNPAEAQDVLLAEYRRPDGPRWTLVQWLKRHRPHNPTVRVIPNR